MQIQWVFPYKVRFFNCQMINGSLVNKRNAKAIYCLCRIKKIAKVKLITSAKHQLADCITVNKDHYMQYAVLHFSLDCTGVTTHVFLIYLLVSKNTSITYMFSLGHFVKIHRRNISICISTT